MKAFISYSHADEYYLERLKKHMKVLERDGLLTSFYDRDILAGDQLDEKIFTELSSSELFLAIVSPDFVASEYCYDKEFKKAQELHDSDQIRIVPVIVEECEWRQSPIGNFLAVPKDGKAIAIWDNENVAFLDAVTQIRKVAEEFAATKQSSAPESHMSVVSAKPEDDSPLKTKYRVKRDFDKVDRYKFREQSFQEIQQFFERSIAEIKLVEGVDARFRKLDNFGFSCTVINETFGRGVAHLTVRMGSDGGGGMGDIFWAQQENSPDNTSNGWASISNSEYEQFFEVHAFSFGSFGADREQVSSTELAKLLWDDLLERAGISYD